MENKKRLRGNNKLSCASFLVIAGNVWSMASVSANEIPVNFNHPDSHRSQDANAKPGDRIVVTIDKTCEDFFNYQSRAFADAPVLVRAHACDADRAIQELGRAGYCKQSKRSLSFVHESGVKAYEISVTKKEEAPARVLSLNEAEWSNAIASTLVNGCAVSTDLLSKADELSDTRYLVTVPRSPWALGTSGGLTISDVVDPRFALVSDPGSTTTPAAQIVIRDEDAEDSKKIGLAGLVHVHNENWRIGNVPVAATFGFSLRDDNALNALIGVSFAAFDLAYLTLGWNWSPVERLPTGQRLNAAPLDANVLNDLPTRTDDSWFIGVSAKFMSPGESFFTGKIVKPEPTEGGDPTE